MKRNSAVVVLAVIIFAIAALAVFSGCTKQYTPDPAVERFLNTDLSGSKALSALKTVRYVTETSVQKKDGTVNGAEKSEVFLNFSDKSNLVMEMTQDYSGSQIQNNVVFRKVVLQRVDGVYEYVVTETTSEASETAADAARASSDKNTITQMSDEDAENLINALVYADNGVYDEGGLYYGDLFMIKIYQYPAESFYVDEQNQLCVFDQKMIMDRQDTGKVRLYQISKVNKLGLLVLEYEKYESVDSDVVMIMQMTPTYQYVEGVLL